MTPSGVRNSWLTIETKLLLSRVSSFSCASAFSRFACASFSWAVRSSTRLSSDAFNSRMRASTLSCRAILRRKSTIHAPATKPTAESPANARNISRDRAATV